MVKFFGAIGYANTTETSPGVWEDDIIEKTYTGDIVRNRRTIHVKADEAQDSGKQINPNITISDTISIIADGFALENLHTMRYVKWRGANWDISSIVVERPRVLLTIGGLYNGLERQSP